MQKSKESKQLTFVQTATIGRKNWAQRYVRKKDCPLSFILHAKLVSIYIGELWIHWLRQILQNCV